MNGFDYGIGALGGARRRNAVCNALRSVGLSLKSSVPHSGHNGMVRDPRDSVGSKPRI